MVEQDIPHPVAVRIVAHLEAAIGGDNVVENTVLALRHLAIGLRELESGASRADLNLITDRLQLAAPIVSRDVERRLLGEHVYLGIAAAAGLVRQLALPLT